MTQPIKPLDAGQMSAENMAAILEVAKEQAQTVFKKLPLLGPITWLMMQQSHTKHTLISQLEWKVLPPIMHDQVKLYMRDGSPLAYVSWAKMSPQVAERYRLGEHHLQYSDWISGDQAWLIDIVVPFGGAQEVMKDIRENVFAGKEVHQLTPTSIEPGKVLTWPVLKAKS
jgi:cytolysin-activating lysine-acyltransferase